MSHNTYGHLFRVTTWGESHGPSIGCVIDGCPPGIGLTTEDIQPWLDRRKPGTSRFVTQRREDDEVSILSGVFEDDEIRRLHGGPVTTGTPISLLIQNTDQRSRDYQDIRELYRPGHADFTYDRKYGLRDYRGGGRSSARETASRVAAGAVARKVLGPSIRLRAAVIQLGPHRINRDNWNWETCESNPFWCPDASAAPLWEEYLDSIRKKGSSCGAIIEAVADGVPPGWGAPIYGKLDADLASAFMSINAVKGVEIGAGFVADALSGEDNADEMRMSGGDVRFLSTNNGGILGGISTGQPIVVRMAVKPTSSILTPRQTVTASGAETDIRTRGRHDPCVGVRAAPVAEAMLAAVLADHKLRHTGQTGR